MMEQHRTTNYPLLLIDSEGDNRRLVIKSDGAHVLTALLCAYKPGRCNAGCAVFSTMNDTDGPLVFACRAFGRTQILGLADPEWNTQELLDALQHGTDLRNHQRAVEARR